MLYPIRPTPQAVNLQVTKFYPFSEFPPRSEEYLSRTLTALSEAIHKNAPLFQNDAAFDWMYPEHFQLISQKQWTPLAVARKAAEFLAEPDAQVLDIGSGIGKFCLTAGYHYPGTTFHGVEQREELVYFAEKTRQYTGLDNVRFIHANITQLDFNAFDHFYFYNSFYENIDPENCIDDTIAISFSLYSYYTQYLYKVLSEKPSGTRLVTFHCFDDVIPIDYCLVNASCNALLRMWIKR